MRRLKTRKKSILQIVPKMSLRANFSLSQIRHRTHIATSCHNPLVSSNLRYFHSQGTSAWLIRKLLIIILVNKIEGFQESLVMQYSTWNKYLHVHQLTIEFQYIKRFHPKLHLECLPLFDYSDIDNITKWCITHLTCVVMLITCEPRYPHV